jgi:hypothetical protein
MKALSSKLFNLLVLLAFAIGNFQIVLSGIPEEVKREGNFKVDRGKNFVNRFVYVFILPH